MVCMPSPKFMQTVKKVTTLFSQIIICEKSPKSKEEPL